MIRNRVRLVLSLAAVSLLGGADTSCAPTAKPSAVKSKIAAPETRTYNFKALGGISMGAIGASFLAGEGSNHTKIDALAAMGGPIDASYFLGGFERMQMGGFCTLQQLETLATASPDQMNNPAAMDCAPAVPVAYEHLQSFNAWQYTDNGGNFDRSQYLDLFFDLSLAMGNPLMYNPNSAIFPVALPASVLPSAELNQPPTSMCDGTMAGQPGGPLVFSKANGNPIYNAEFNPDGSHPVITFCDGQEPIYYCNDAAQSYVDWCQIPASDISSNENTAAQNYCESIGGTSFQNATTDNNPDLFYLHKGHYDPCYPHTHPVTFGLAVDFNGNGVRDYFEPIFGNGHERFSDVGTDGCADAYEDGKGGCSTTPTGLTGDPNHDNYDYLTNQTGTEGNWRWEQGEPFEDNGLDGVPNTGDYGEGNGKYDDSPGRQNWFAHDFRTNYLSWSDQERRSLDVYAEGGYRDVFNFGLSADFMTSGTRELYPWESGRFLAFTDLPALPAEDNWSGGYDGTQVDWDAAGRNVYIRYGDPNSSITEIRDGDGDHVGTAGQVVERAVSFISWLSHVWQKVLPAPRPNNGTFATVEESPFLQTLQAKRNFVVMTPPGYDDAANAKVRYPVVTMGHGYGMDPDSMASGTAFLFASFMQSGNIRPMIVVYPSGKCCYTNTGTGARDCREADDQGKNYSDQQPTSTTPGWVAECVSGNFYQNRQGFTPANNTAYGDSMWEILDYVDQNYRTLGPVTVPLDPEP